MVALWTRYPEIAGFIPEYPHHSPVVESQRLGIFPHNVSSSPYCPENFVSPGML